MRINALHLTSDGQPTVKLALAFSISPSKSLPFSTNIFTMSWDIQIAVILEANNVVGTSGLTVLAVSIH